MNNARPSIPDEARQGTAHDTVMSIQQKQNLYQMITQDPGLDEDKKQTLLAALQDGKTFDHIMSGAMGGSLAYLLSKFLRLSPTSQILLSLAGFGAGSVVYDKMHSGKAAKGYMSLNDDGSINSGD